MCAREHLAHIGNVGCIPVSDWLIEGACFQEHPAHISNIRNIPIYPADGCNFHNVISAFPDFQAGHHSQWILCSMPPLAVWSIELTDSVLFFLLFSLFVLPCI